MSVFSFEIWSIFFSLIIFFTLFDLGVLGKSSSAVMSPKIAACMTALWISLALAFACFVWYNTGFDDAKLFLTGYLLELSLSIDNLFIFILILSNFKISKKGQHKILLIGIFSAIAMRFLMISSGIYLIQKFQWVFYVFGSLLIYSGIKIIFELYKKKSDINVNSYDKVLQWFKKFLPIYSGDHDNKLFITIDKKRYVTPLFCVMILIEQADIVFALDSIPAILAITDNLFIVFTSNIFAILGLRSMYFFLSSTLEKFLYIKYALSVILCFIGIKMIASAQGLHISIMVSLGVIITSVLIAVFLSVLRYKIDKKS